jgi:hypothetical protein
MSPYAITWIAVDIAALALVAVAVTRDGPGVLELRTLMAAQALVIAATIVAAAAPLNAYAEWTLMVAVNLGYALASWRGGIAGRSLAMIAIAATTLSVALVLLKTFISIIAVAVGLVFAVGALLAALLQMRQARSHA